jgi:hypothetical protein
MRNTVILSQLRRLPSFSKTLAVLALVGYLGFGFFGFLHLLQMASGHMHHAVADDCPFVRIEHSVCTATLTSHVRVWQDLTSLLFPLTHSLWLLTTSLFVGLALACTRTERKQFLYAKNQAPPRYNNLLQSLFSQGLLNPKAY